MISQKPSVLIVDDAVVVCNVLSDQLGKRGYYCVTAFGGNEALAKLAAQNFEVVLLDIRLPDISGMEVLARIRLNHPKAETIMMTVVNDVNTAVDAMKLGALDYIVKPFNLDRLDNDIRTALENRKRLPKSGNDRQTIEKSFNKMNAIARGVEARHDLFFGHSSMMIQETVDIARRLGIPEEEIQGWVEMISEQNSRRNAAITSSLNKLRQSPLARRIVDMGMLYPRISKLDEPQN